MPCPETNVKKAMDVHVYEGKLANFGILLQIDNMFQTFHLYLITKATFAFYKLKFWEVCSKRSKPYPQTLEIRSVLSANGVSWISFRCLIFKRPRSNL